ncbi:protein TTE1956-like X2, partial [Biomphalaria pfeifferi]
TKLECYVKHGYAIFDDTNMWLWVPSTLRLHEETIKATEQSIVHITRSSKQKSPKDAVLFMRKPAHEAAAWKSKYDRFTDVEIIATTLEVSL